MALKNCAVRLGCGVRKEHIFSISALAESLSPIATTPDGKSIIACYTHVSGDNPVTPGTQATWDTIIIRNSEALRSIVNDSIVQSNKRDSKVYRYIMKRTPELCSLEGHIFEGEGTDAFPLPFYPQDKLNTINLPVPPGTFFTARGFEIGLFLYSKISGVFANVVPNNSYNKDLGTYICTSDLPQALNWLPLVFKHSTS